MPDVKPSSGGKLSASLKKVPPWAWVVAAGAIVLVYVLGRRKGSTALGQPTQTAGEAPSSLLDFGAPAGQSASVGVGGSPVLNPTANAGQPVSFGGAAAASSASSSSTSSSSYAPPPLASSPSFAGAINAARQVLSGGGSGYIGGSYSDYVPSYSPVAVQVAGTGYTGYVSTPTNAGGNTRVGSGAAID